MPDDLGGYEDEVEKKLTAMRERGAELRKKHKAKVDALAKLPKLLSQYETAAMYFGRCSRQDEVEDLADRSQDTKKAGEIVVALRDHIDTLLSLLTERLS